jgi:putative ABC transport system permease protein
VRGGEFYRTLLQQALHLPGATSASLADRLPLEPPQNAEVYPEGRPQTDGRRFVLHFARVTPGFLKTLGISLVRGRDFTEHDTEATPRVALINEIVARRLWAGEDAIGKRLLIKTLGSKSANGQLVEVVGIVKETKVKSLNESPSGYLYLPFEQFYSARMQLIVSGRDNPAYWLERLKKLVHELDPHLAIIQRKTMSEHVGLLLYPIRISAALSAGFGFLGLLLASLGIYGVIAYSVAQRTRELGIRMALGARRADVLRLVVAEGLKVVAIGSVIGLLLAVATTRLLSSLLFGVSATDPVAFVGMPVIAGGVALLACYLPARRAIKVDPMVALRYE